ncbi:unnamed protein product [Musa hybrid cultivar]
MRMSSNEFVEMMLLDGSFVIEIIISWNTIWSLLAVAQDMLLLENQLPFFLLDRLYDTAFPEDAGGQTELTQEFLRMFIMFMNDNERVPSHGGPDFHHILHLCHFCILPAKKPNDSDSDSFEQPVSLITWIRCATQLKEAGIQFKIKKRAKSLLDIRMESWRSLSLWSVTIPTCCSRTSQPSSSAPRKLERILRPTRHSWIASSTLLPTSNCSRKIKSSSTHRATTPKSPISSTSFAKMC